MKKDGRIARIWTERVERVNTENCRELALELGSVRRLRRVSKIGKISILVNENNYAKSCDSKCDLSALKLY